MSNVQKRRMLPFGETINKFIHKYPDLRYDGAKIFCKVCEKSLICRQERDCKMHVNCKQHLNKKNGVTPTTLFLFDLLFMVIACGLPLHLLDKPEFRHFWRKYNLNWQLPSRGTLRKHIPSVREDVENRIKSALKHELLWLCVGETTNCKKQSVMHVIVRILKPSKPTSAILLASKGIDNCAVETITKVVHDTLKRFEVSLPQVLMFMSDGTRTMLSVGRSLKENGGRFVHVTCKMHGLHVVTQIIRDSYPKVDALIANTKRVFFKSPKCIRQFSIQCPGIPQPPQPIVTFWGTWLKAVSYYAKYYQEIKSVVFKFNTNEAAAIKESQKQFRDTTIEADVKIIHDNYAGLYDKIEQLQNTSLSLGESLQIVNGAYSLLRTISIIKNKSVIEKFESVINEEFDFTRLKQICSGAYIEPLSIYKDYFNYACLTSVDVERSFSRYKNILTSRQASFGERTVETYLMLQSFYTNSPACHNVASTSFNIR